MTKGAGGDRSLYRWFFLGSAIFILAFEAIYFHFARPPLDGLNYPIGRDFVNMWMGGHAALNGDFAAYFDLARYNELLRHVFGPSVHPHNWSYPPHILLLIWPFGLLPYLTSYIVWTVVGFAFFLAVGSDWTLDRHRLLFLALAPVALVNIATGQNGFFTAAMLLTAIWNWDKRPALSGVMFGLLTIKPQIIFLIPLVLILTRRWRVMAYAAATAVVMVALTTLIFGAGVWSVYYHLAMPVQDRILTHGRGTMLTMMPTPFIGARLMGLPLPIAWVLQGIFSALAVAAVAWSYWKPRDRVLSTAVLLTASLLATPYGFNYDMAALTIVLGYLRERKSNTIADVAYILALWSLPVAMMVFGMFFNTLAGPALILTAFLARLIARLREEEAHQSSSAGSSSSAFSSSPATVSMTRTSCSGS